jgi:hypothetical protein
MTNSPQPKKTLVLHIEVPGVYADDLPASAAECVGEGQTPGSEDYLFVVTEEWMRPEVGLTIVTLPGEKNLNEDFEVHAYTGRVVGAEVRDHPDRRGPEGGARDEQ